MHVPLAEVEPIPFVAVVSRHGNLVACWAHTGPAGRSVASVAATMKAHARVTIELVIYDSVPRRRSRPDGTQRAVDAGRGMRRLVGHE